jgi:hypothetical protein
MSNDLPTGPLSENELKILRRIIRDDDNTRFFWRTVRLWVGWIGGVIGTIWIGWETISKAAHALFRTFSGNGS